MRLGLVLLHIAKPKLPYRFRGKNRIVKEPSRYDLFKMKQDFEREERNMLILRHPYLTVEQGQGYMKDLLNRPEEFMKQIEKVKIKKFSKQITFTDRLNHLGIAENWD